MDGIDLALARAQEERSNLQCAFDADLYGAAGDRFEGYHTSIPASGDEEDDLSAAGPTMAPRLALASYTGYDAALPSDHEDHTSKSRRIIDHENEYRRRRLYRCISPQRHDAFAAGEATLDPSVRTYADAMRDNRLQHREEEVLREIAKVKEEQKRRDRWDATAVARAKNASSAWEDDDDAPDAVTAKKQRSRWDDDALPKKKQMLRWDDETPLGAEYLATPTPSEIAACVPTTPEQHQYLSWERKHTRPLTDVELDAMFPQNGYKILKPPASYKPIRTLARRILATTPRPLCPTTRRSATQISGADAIECVQWMGAQVTKFRD